MCGAEGQGDEGMKERRSQKQRNVAGLAGINERAGSEAFKVKKISICTRPHVWRPRGLDRSQFDRSTSFGTSSAVTEVGSKLVGVMSENKEDYLYYYY